MKYKKGLGFNRLYLKPVNVMAGSYKIRTYKQWKELLESDFGKSIGVEW